MDEPTAIRIAESARPSHDVPSGHAFRRADPRIIELVDQRPDGTALVRDARVWVVRFQGGISWVELAVENPGGAVVRVQRSRAS